MARYLCNHGTDENPVTVDATYYLRALSTRKWHGKEALDPQWSDKAYACCNEHLALAMRYLMEGSDGTAVLKVSRVKNPPRDL